MSLQRFTPPRIVEQVAPRQFGPNATLDQAAEFERMTVYFNRHTQELTVTVDTVATYYVPNGQFDTPAQGPGIGQYAVQLVANNQAAVNLQTREVELLKGPSESQAAFEARVDAQPGEFMLQGEFMAYAMNYEPVVVAQQLREQMQKANVAPFNRWG